MSEIYRWKTKEEIDPNNIIEVIEWANHFSGVNRQSNDVSRALERCVIGAYQCGYLPDCNERLAYVQGQTKDALLTFIEDTLASVLIHSIAAYEMTGREAVKLNMLSCRTWEETQDIYKPLAIRDFWYYYQLLSEHMFKYQRWMLYLHMDRTKRWNEEEFKVSLEGLIEKTFLLSCVMGINLTEGFRQSILKLQDGEIRRH